jgi:hypothetical protein
MAEIYKNPDLILTPSVNEPSAGGKEHTGNNEIDAYINSLPEDEREEALLAITAPKTGEDIHNEMLAGDQQGIVADPSKEDWLKLNQFYRTRDTDYLKAISEGAGHIYDTFGKAVTSLADDPSMENFSKITPSVMEGATQNLRMLYGIAAESADSTSPQAKFFNLLNGRTEDSDEAYRVFLEARHFNRESQQYVEGKKTILTDKRHLNNDFVQAAALVADPTMFIPFGKAFTLAGGVLGMSERSMVLGARTAALKSKIIGGSLKYGVGMPIEFIGKGTRVTLDHAIATGEKAFVAATGVSSETFREGMRMSGVGSLGAGYFGHSVPLLTDASGAYVAGTAAAGIGEAVSVIGHQIMKGERGIASYAKQALIDSAKQGVELSAHSKALLKIINGFDPLVDYTTTIAQGAAHGSMIGAGLGYWSGGEEGMAQGIGAGIALGSVGGTAGRVLADVTGRTTRHRTHIQAKLVLEGLRDVHPEQARSWERAEAWARTRGFSLDGILAAKDTIHPNTHIEVLTNREYANYLAEHGLNPDTYDGKTFLKDGDQPLSLRSFEQQNGYVVENRANGTVKIYLNADAAPRATMGHELFHSILRNSVMKDYYAQAVKEKVIGSRDAEGNLTNRGVVDIAEVKEMFRRYLDAEFKDPAERADAQARLDMAEAAFESNGQLVSDPSLGGRPLLEHLSEEFGAYYFSHLVMDKPIDWLYHGGDLPGIRGVLDNAKMLYQNYWRSRMNLTAPEFDFNRTFVDENGFEKLVPIDEVFAPAAKDMFGNITGKTKRVVNPAMDLFFRDMLRIEKKVNETGQFEISRLDKRSQERFIESEGLDGIFTKDVAGNYQHSTEAQIKRENRIKGKAVYQLLMGVPEAERTFVVDADGNIRGHLTPQMLDNIVNAGHMSRAMANKISLFQSIARGEAAGNIVDFGGIGSTAERPMDVNNPSRMYGKRVPYKNRTAIIFGLDTVIGKNGQFQFKGNMLDYKVIETRANNEWSNLDVQRLWNGNHTEYLADFFRYLENASKSHDDPTRVPSAELWTDGKGGERRNVLHQVLGMAKGEADTFLNTPKAEINRNAYSTVMSFSLNRMTNLRLRNQSVPFKFENAYRDLVRNWSPAEMDSELTPRGTVFKHPSGFKFVQREDGKTDAFDELGKRIGTYQTAKEATEAGRRYALKHPSTVMLKDNMTDNSVINRSPNQGEGEVPLISRSEAAEARRIGDLFKTPEMQEFVGDRKLVRQTADEGYTDFITKFREGEIDQRTALYMLDEMSKDMFGGLDRQTKRIRLKELKEIAKANFEKENPRLKGMYKSELPDNRVEAYIPFSDLFEFRKLNKELAQQTPQSQRHGEFTREAANEFARKVEEAKRWVRKASPTYNDFAGYIADNVPLREYYQHAVYAKQFRTGEPVVVVGVHGTSTSEGFVKSGRYSASNKSLDAGEVAGAYFASSDSTALSGEYQGYDKGGTPPNIAKSAIRFDNPFVVDGQFTDFMKRTEKILGEAIEKGHDGVIYINQTDGGGLDVSFIVPAEKANQHQRMIGSTREKARAGASYEPLPRGEGVTNRTVNLSPNEGTGELGTSRFGVPREEPIYRDSIGYYEQFAIDRNRELPFDPTYFESLVTKNRGKKGVEATLNFDNAPNPKYHNLWQYLDYHQQAKSTVTVGDVLNFIKEQGIHTAPNMPVDIHSKYAQMLLALSDTNQLNTRVELLNSGHWTGGEKIVTMTRQYQQILVREATLRERYNILTAQYQKAPTIELKKELNNLKKHLEGTQKEKEKTKDDIKEATEERKLRDEEDSEDGDAETKDKYRFPIRMVREKKSHQQMFLNLAELIDKTWAADTYKHTLGDYSGSERARRQQALQGHSFEGTALEELAHSIFGRITREAGEAAPELVALINTDSPTSVSGDAWKHNVNKFLGKTKQQIKDGIILPPSVVAFARILELQKYAAENTYIMNPKGIIETLWESKGYKLNDNVYTDKGKPKSNRGSLKKGYRIINPWEFDNKGKNPFKGDQEYNVPNSWKEGSVYRLGSTQEFMIALLNDPTHLARWNHMPVKPSLLDALNTPDVDVGFQNNVANLHNQMSDALSQFIGYERTFSHQILEEMIRTINAGREGAGSNAPADIQRVDVGNKRGVQRSQLPKRPDGFLTPYEKAFVNDWRFNMERWAEANAQPNALEGLSDFEIWQRVGEDQPPFLGSDEAMKDPALWKVNAKDITESRSQGFENQWVRDNEKKYLEETKELEESRKNLRVARWNEDLQKWEMVGDDEGSGVDATKDPIVDPIDKDKDTTVYPDKDKDGGGRDKEPDKDKDGGGRDKDKDKDNRGRDRDKDKDRDGRGRDGKDRDGRPPIPPAPVPKRTFTDADIRVWRSWKTETYGNGSALKNALGYIIMSLNKNYRVYNPEKVLIGIYKNEEEAKRRVQREEPKR